MRWKLMRNRWPAMLAVVLLVGSLAGCANLGAIRSYAEKSSSISGYTKLVNDYVNAPKESAPYLPAAQQAQLAEAIKSSSELKEALIARHKIIQSYMESLGRLASDETVVYDKEITSLGKAIQDNKFMTQTDATAFTELAKLIAKALTDYWRQKELKSLIKRANQPVQTLIASMRSVVDKNYVNALNTEERAIKGYYDDILADSKDPAGKEALKEIKNQRLAVIEIRRKEIVIYSKALSDIGGGHQELFKNLEQLDAKAVLDQMVTYARYLQNAKNALESM